MLPGERLLRSLERGLLVLSGALLLLMMVHITADVLGKFLLNLPIVGTLEIVANYYMVAAVFFPLALIQAGKGHIMVEVFTQNLGAQTIARFDLVGALLSMVYVLALAWTSLEAAVLQTAIGENWSVMGWYMPIWPARWIVPIGLVVLLIQFGYDVVRYAGRGSHVAASAGPAVPAHRHGAS